MASSEVDQKFLGRLAQKVEHDNPLLASVLFKILGLSLNLSEQLIAARKQRRTGLPTTTTPPTSAAAADAAKTLKLHCHIIWLSREGLVLLEQYVLPMVGNHVELKVLAYKLRASFYHIFVLFHNTPPVATAFSTPEGQTSATVPPLATPSRIDKGKGIARDDEDEDQTAASGSNPPIIPHAHALHHATKIDGGPVNPPPGFGPAPPTAFLLKPGDYLPQAHQCFREAVALAEQLLWGSHSLRLSVKTEYAAFLYECVRDAEGSRRLAKDTIAEVYDATEGIDNDMFNDACELVTVLGKMMKRGLGAGGGGRGGGAEDGATGAAGMSVPPVPAVPAGLVGPSVSQGAPPGMI